MNLNKYFVDSDVTPSNKVSVTYNGTIFRFRKAQKYNTTRGVGVNQQILCFYV